MIISELKIMQVVVDTKRKLDEEIRKQQALQRTQITVQPARVEPKMEVIQRPVAQQMTQVQEVHAPIPYDASKRQNDISELIELKKLELLGIGTKPAAMTTTTPKTGEGRKLEIVKLAEDLSAEAAAFKSVKDSLLASGLIQPDKNPVESILNTEFGKGLGMMVSQFGMGLVQDFQQMRRLKFEEQRMKMMAANGQLPQQQQQVPQQQPQQQSQPEAAQQYQQSQQQQGPSLKLDDADRAILSSQSETMSRVTDTIMDLADKLDALNKRMDNAEGKVRPQTPSAPPKAIEISAEMMEAEKVKKQMIAESTKTDNELKEIKDNKEKKEGESKT